MSAHENPNEEIRIYGMQSGTVLDRADPMALGRVRVTIPGVADEGTDWALPLGGGAPQYGFKFVPPTGADVVVWFLQGDPDRPYYMAAHWGQPDTGSEIPTDAIPTTENGLTPETAPDVHTIELKHFKVTIDERAEKESLTFTHKRSGDSFEIDGKGPGMTIKTSAALIFETDGLLRLSGAQVQINERVVSDGTHPI